MLVTRILAQLETDAARAEWIEEHREGKTFFKVDGKSFRYNRLWVNRNTGAIYDNPKDKRNCLRLSAQLAWIANAEQREADREARIAREVERQERHQAYLERERARRERMEFGGGPVNTEPAKAKSPKQIAKAKKDADRKLRVRQRSKEDLERRQAGQRTWSKPQGGRR